MLRRIAVTGTPGTGKSAVAKLLAERLGWRLVEVNALAGQAKAFAGFDCRRKSRIVDMKKLRAAAAGLEHVVFAGHLAHELACDCIVVLRCEPAVLRRRLKRRRWPERKVRENVEAELFGVILEEARGKKARLIVVDTTKKRAVEAVAEVIYGLRSAMPRSPSSKG